MNRKSILVVLTLSLLAQAILAQSYSIEWFTSDGGGGTSTNGQFAITGTIGQPGASAPMASGNFSVTGGFWSLLSVVQTPGAPLLSISLTTTNTAIVSWPSALSGFILQQNTKGIGTANWSNVVASPTDNGTMKYILFSPPMGSRFFRLFNP